MKDFKQLMVWQKSHQFTLEVYAATKVFPKDESFGLVSQIRRSSSSIPTNIAEGCGRGSNADFAHFLQISMGSASEAEYQIILSRDLNYINEQTYTDLSSQVSEIKRMLTSLINKCKKSD